MTTNIKSFTCFHPSA